MMFPEPVAERVTPDFPTKYDSHVKQQFNYGLIILTLKTLN